MENRCYVCGDAGFEECLATCMKCKILIHVYCMETVKPDDLPDDWVCDDCRETPIHAAGKFSGGVRVPKRSVMLLPPDEAMALATPFSLPKGPKGGDSCKDTLKATKNAGGRRRLSDGKVEGGYSYRDTLKASKNAGERRLRSDGQVEIDRCLPNPLSFARWKGCFNISGVPPSVCSLDVVWGYPPIKVGLKASKFVKKMPSVLHLKAIPRCTVWAKMFNDRGPDSNDIGLYLLPVGVRSDRCYSSLMSHIEKQDIVLQNFIQGAQLLIFSSSHLDEKSQKIKQAYYLWGLFVAPNITFKRPELKQHAPENEQTVDMEIDMLGGAPVGTIDVHIPRNLPLSSSKKSEDAVAATQPVSHTQVKLEKCEVDGLGSPPGFPARAAWVEPGAPPGFEDMLGREPIGQIDVPIPGDFPLSSSKKSILDGLGSPPGFPARAAWVEPGAPPGFEDMLGRAPIGQIDVPIPGDSPLSSSKKSINAAAGSQSVPQVKPEKWDGLGSPPGFPAQTAWVEPRVPPGFEETGRLKYKTMNEIYSMNLEIEDEAN